MKLKSRRTLILVACILAYLSIGAFLFKFAEYSNAKNQREILRKEVVDFREFYNLTDDELNELVELLRLQRQTEAQWDYVGSFYFVSVVLTLVGYGHQTPKTKLGKVVLMVYCLIGIPLTLNVLQMAGEGLNALLVEWMSLLKWKLKKNKRIDEQRSCLVSVIELVVAESVLMAFVVCLGACFFNRYEQWSFLDSVYYAITTLTTIGFGDFVPMRKRRLLWHLWNAGGDDQLSYPENSVSSAQVVFSIVFLFNGLTIAASLSNLLVRNLIAFYNEEKMVEALRKQAALKIHLNLVAAATMNQRTEASGKRHRGAITLDRKEIFKKKKKRRR